jgi:hypothetical protein
MKDGTPGKERVEGAKTLDTSQEVDEHRGCFQLLSPTKRMEMVPLFFGRSILAGSLDGCQSEQASRFLPT